MSDWRFCPLCSAGLETHDVGGLPRLICRARCGFVHWDNPAPVLAALVECRGRIVLARNRAWAAGAFGLITGFLERGEEPAVGVAREDGLVTYHYEVMRARAGHDPWFLAYLMKSEAFISELVRMERGIGAGEQANVRTTEVPFSVLRLIDVLLPSLSVQRLVAAFLDRETAKIDALIAKQDALVARLREHRRSAIVHAVEAVLDPSSGARFKHFVTVMRQGWSPQCESVPADVVAEWGVLKTGCVNGGVSVSYTHLTLPTSDLV